MKVIGIILATLLGYAYSYPYFQATKAPPPACKEGDEFNFWCDDKREKTYVRVCVLNPITGQYTLEGDKSECNEPEFEPPVHTYHPKPQPHPHPPSGHQQPHPHPHPPPGHQQPHYVNPGNAHDQQPKDRMPDHPSNPTGHYQQYHGPGSSHPQQPGHQQHHPVQYGHGYGPYRPQGNKQNFFQTLLKLFSFQKLLKKGDDTQDSSNFNDIMKYYMLLGNKGHGQGLLGGNNLLSILFALPGLEGSPLGELGDIFGQLAKNPYGDLYGSGMLSHLGGKSPFSMLGGNPLEDLFSQMPYGPASLLDGSSHYPSFLNPDAPPPPSDDFMGMGYPMGGNSNIMQMLLAMGNQS